MYDGRNRAPPTFGCVISSNAVPRVSIPIASSAKEAIRNESTKVCSRRLLRKRA